MMLLAEDPSVKDIHLQNTVDNPMPQGDFDRLTIPLKRVQNLFMIEARIDSVQGNFIFDTGAPHMVLNKTYFRKGKLSEGTASLGITGGGAQVYHKNIDSLIIKDLYFTGLSADLVNLGHLEDAKGVKILGLLGADIFYNMEIEIDAKNSVLYLYKLDQQGNSLSLRTDLTPMPGLQLKTQVENNIMFIQGTVGTKQLRFCLDTGAETNVMSNTVSNKVLDHFLLTGRRSLGGVGNQRVEVLTGKIDKLQIGTTVFADMPFILTGLEYLQTAYNTNVNGILGYDFFMKGRVILNFKKKTLIMYFYDV